MAHVNGIATAGVTEANRLAQSVVHRGAETAALVVAGQREDRVRAERIPKAERGERITERPHRERRSPHDDRHQDDREPADEQPTGSLIDLQA
jgi:hypothetical protein